MTLQATLQAPYSRDAWIALLRDLFGPSAALFSKPAPVTDPGFQGVFTRVLHLGDLQTADGKTAALLDIEVAPDLSLPRNRAGIRHLAARLIDGSKKQGILAAFHNSTSPDWRFSFIIREKSLDIATGETLTHETPARRFTYLLGPSETCRTAAERFATLQGRAVTLADIETAFKVDKLTREFYGELSDWFFWALTQVKFPADIEKDKDTRNATMTIRLITRLMFVWFLKKKGVIPDTLFDKAAVDHWLSYTDATGSTYYKAILQNLFFATLNFDPKEGARGFVEWGKKGVLAYRYKRFFKRGAADRFLDVCRGIPFLNGGLFENLDKDVETAAPRRLDCFSNAEENEKRLAVPDSLFFAKEQIVDLSSFYDDKRKSAVRVKGLFEILNAYNFTVEENTPYDQEVALDPELLGQVFENLLASYNPETRTTARKQTGSFYTPREIVQYMVDESLKAHLLQQMGQAFLPAGSPTSHSLSDSSPSQTGMSAPPCAGQVLPSGDPAKVGQAFLPAHSAAWQMGADDALAIFRRRLPHWRHDGAIYWVTFRLADSIPADKLRAWQEERAVWLHHHPAPWTEKQWAEYDKRFGERFEAWLDAGMGSCALSRADVRQAVTDCLLRFDGERLNVHAAVIMPTHVHALIEPLSDGADKVGSASRPERQTGMSASPCNELSTLLKGIKGASARMANKLLGTSGTFWLDESYDHIVRSEKQYVRFLDYIAQNPVKASLCESAYWLYLPHQRVGQAVPPADPAKVGQAFLPASQPTAHAPSDSYPSQTGMSAPRTGMSAPPHADPKVGQAFLPALQPELSQRLDALFSYTDEPLHFTEAERAAIVQALFTCKILDPACGSGAFPMGVLQQMVHILNRLDPDNTYLKTQALKQVEEETRAVVNDASALDDKIEKMRDTLRLFDETATRPDYARKLLLIENNIFGVDIQPVAVQIAKLRFFISLIVEQPTYGGADIPVCAGQAGMPAPPCNDDIRPLPNLETNFVAANTLIGIAKPADTLFADDPQVAAIERELKANRHRHFFARTTRTKLTCRKEDKRLRDRLQQRLIALASKPDEAVIADNLARIAKLEADRIRFLDEKWEARKQAVQNDLFGAAKPEQQALPLRVDVNKSRREAIDADIRHCQARIAAERRKAENNAFTREAEKLALWDPYDQNATSPFFDPEWMFGITGGFDVVIGNPPYVRQESIKDQKPLLKAQGYESFEGTADLFVYFYERGLKMLAPEAHLCFITSNKYLRAGYGGNVRAFLSGRNRLRQLIDFGDAPVFEAIAYPSILLAQQGAPAKGHTLRAFTWRPGPAITEFPALFAKHAFVLEQSALRPEGWQLERREVLALLDKLRAAGTPLGEYVKGRFYYGIKTGLNEAFVVDRATRDRLIAEHPSSAEILKPFLRGRDVKRWRCAFAEQYLIKIASSENAKHPWSGMEPKRAEAVFAKTFPAVHAFMRSYRQALITRADQGNYFWELRSCAYWDVFSQPKIIYPDIYEHQSFAWDMEGFYSVNTTYFIPTDEKWLTALLNSKAVEWFYSQTANRIRGGYLRAFSDYISQIPIPSATPAQQAALAALVGRILAAKVGQAFLPAGRPSPHASSDSSPSQTGMSTPLAISALEAEIDRLVYGLYGLAAPEVAIVEGQVS